MNRASDAAQQQLEGHINEMKTAIDKYNILRVVAASPSMPISTHIAKRLKLH